MASNKTERRGSRAVVSNAKGGGKREAAKIDRGGQSSQYISSDMRYAEVDRTVYLDSCTSD